MSWADDTRCLYCDGKLPLYRKLTNGQFCSPAHRKAYWQDQERLAVERLQQTHRTLRAIQVPVVQEEPLIEAAVPEPSHLPEPAPPMPGVISVDVPYKVIDVTCEVIVGDALECGLSLGVSHPSLAHQPTAELQEPERLPIRLPLLPSPAGLLAAPSHTSWPESGIARPSGSGVSECALTPAGRVALALRMVDAARWVVPSVEPIPVQPRINTDSVTLHVAPQTEELQRLLDDQVSLCERTFRIIISARDCDCERKLEPGAELGMNPRAALPQRSTEIESGSTLPEGSSVPLALPVPSSAITTRAADLEAAAVSPSAVELPAFASTIETVPNMAATVIWRDVLPADSRTIRGIAPETMTPAFRVALPASRNVRVEVSPAESSGRMYPLGLAIAPLDFSSERESDPVAEASTLKPQRPVSRLSPIAPAGEWEEGFRSPVFTIGGMVNFWKSAPRDLRLLAVAIPVLLALAFHPSLPTVRLTAQTPAGGIQNSIGQAFEDRWKEVKRNISSRAGLELSEDFRNGLDNWESRGDLTTSWSYDQSGFVKPGPLAVYKPSADLGDYTVEFLGQIEKKALSWVVRADDLDNYYAVRLVTLKGGPLPTIGVSRYAVINGKAEKPVEIELPENARMDTLYRVRMDVRGPNYALMVQGRVVASWSDTRLTRGGVGFFSAKGEQSRVRWVVVTHQYDMLGRLCAYLAPYNFQPANGSWKQ